MIKIQLFLQRKITRRIFRILFPQKVNYYLLSFFGCWNAMVLWQWVSDNEKREQTKMWSQTAINKPFWLSGSDTSESTDAFFFSTSAVAAATWGSGRERGTLECIQFESNVVKWLRSTMQIYIQLHYARNYYD